MNIILLLTTKPMAMIILGVLLITIVGYLFLPEKGLFAYLKKTKQLNQRIKMEDTLKFLFNCEYKKDEGNISKEGKIKRLAKHLEDTESETRELIESLETMNLVNLSEKDLKLTDSGRSYALRIIRIHRVWEQYLADKTGVHNTQWHHQADKIEHTISIEEADKIASKLGNPVFDPHGDPIPTAKGDLPKAKGKPLNEIKEGEIVRIIHIEDEPHEIYEQLYLLGLYPGMKLLLSKKTEEKILFVANGDEVVLTPAFAKQITVEVSDYEHNPEIDLKTLSSLQVGEEAEIISISEKCIGQQRRRLLDLGFIEGHHIKAVIESASGDPIGYQILGTTVGLRKQQSDLIFIKKGEDKK